MLTASGRLKPPDPIWQPNYRPAGCRGYYALTERTGGTVRDFSGNKFHGTAVGSPAWSPGPFGSQLGGFSTSNYVAIDPPSPINAAFPFWLAVMATNTSTTNGYALMAGYSPSSVVGAALRWNNAIFQYFLRDSTATADVSFASPAVVDGLPHVLMGISYSNSDHRLYLDGLQVGTSSVAVTLPTFDRLTLGAYRASSPSSPFPGVISSASWGNGGAPNPRTLAQDWLGGQFAAVRPRRRSLLFAAGVSASVLPTKIASGESVPTPSAAASTTITTTAIPSAESFGAASLASATTITTTMIPSGESFGSASVGAAVTITCTAIPSGETFGSLSLSATATIAPDIIGSAEAFGNAVLSASTTIDVVVISSAESFGSVLVFQPSHSTLYPRVRRLAGLPDPARTTTGDL